MPMREDGERVDTYTVGLFRLGYWVTGLLSKVGNLWDKFGALFAAICVSLFLSA